MSIETTQTVTRKEAIEKIIESLAAKMVALNTMSNQEIEDLLYALTRDTNYFDNFRVKDDV